MTENKFGWIKTFWTWFIGLATLYQIGLVIAICSGLGWSITNTIQDTRYNDCRKEVERVSEDFKDYKTVSDTRIANLERTKAEEVEYWKRKYDNSEIEKYDMMKKAIEEQKAARQRTEAKLDKLLNHEK